MKKKPEKTVLVAAQEISFARFLASNDKHVRDRALKRLRKWFLSKSHEPTGFTEEGFMRVWKGLFYCVWMSDKPLIQEEVVETTSNLIHALGKFEDALMFMRCFFQGLSQAWFGIDNFRIDKYLMLVRRTLRQWLTVLSKGNWKSSQVSAFAEEIRKGMNLAPLGLNLHFTEVYLEEVAKVGQGKLSRETVFTLVKPFGHVMAESSDTRLINHISKNIFIHLMKQSEEGIKFDMKYEAWKEMGFPGGDIDLVKEVDPDEESDVDEEEAEEEEEEEIEEKEFEEPEPMENDGETPLDPRAGKVDVVLPPIDFDPKSIKDFLSELKTLKDTTTRARKIISTLVGRYAKFESGKFPLGIQKLPVVEREEEDLDEAVDRLNEELKEVEGDRDEVTLEDLNPKKRKGVWDVSDYTYEGKEMNTSTGSTGSWDVTDTSTSEGEVFTAKKKTKHKQEEDSPQVQKNVFLATKIDDDNRADEKPKVNSLGLETPPMSDLDSSIGHTPMPKKNKKRQHNGTESPASADNGSPAGNNVTPTLNSRPSIPNKTSSSPRTLFQKRAAKRPKGNQEMDNSWGSNPWDDGETEVVIPCPSPFKKLKGKGRKSLTSTPDQLNSSLNNKLKNGTPGSGKKVAFVLNRNTSQEATEYRKTLKEKPSIPFDAEKKPAQGVLKPTSIESPINPFYRHIVKPLHTKKYF